MPKFTRHILIAIFAIFAIAVLMPMRAAMGMIVSDTRFTITAKNIVGTIWDGHIDGLKIGPAQIGDVQTRMKFFPLLAGKTNIIVKGSANLSGQFISGWGNKEIRDMNGDFPLAQYIGPVPLAKLELHDVSVKLTQGNCREARGNIRLRLSPQFETMLKMRDGFFGSVTCQNGAISMALISQSAMERIDIRIMNGHEHKSMMIINDPEPNLIPLLISAGFSAISGGYQISVKGKF